MTHFQWTIQIEASEALVADGFNLTAAQLQEALQRAVGCHGSHLTVTVVAAPNPEDIEAMQK